MFFRIGETVLLISIQSMRGAVFKFILRLVFLAELRLMGKLVEFFLPSVLTAW